MQTSQELYILFRNISHLLRQDLRKYKMYDVEKRNFLTLLNFLRDVERDANSFAEHQRLASQNLAAGYSIPVMFDTIERQRDILSDWFTGSPRDKRAIIGTMHSLLKKYYTRKVLDDNLKKGLSLFFDSLARRYRDPRQFEIAKQLNRKPKSLVRLGQYAA